MEELFLAFVPAIALMRGQSESLVYSKATSMCKAQQATELNQYVQGWLLGSCFL